MKISVNKEKAIIIFASIFIVAAVFSWTQETVEEEKPHTVDSLFTDSLEVIVNLQSDSLIYAADSIDYNI
ncbi:MAG: hypothetical protein U9P73_06010, partial [Candidatus Cloacimonadota bacterium]|nr:hypothetical protein [Candidatus Cloacimonadota bacterium]